MNRAIRKRYESILVSAAATIFCIIFTLWRYKTYYDLNDDVLIKDILSGVYTGTPEALDIQMLSPLSFVISLFYRLFPVPDWYAVLLLFGVFSCFFCVTNRIISSAYTITGKFLCSAMTVLSFTAFGASHVVFMHYTVVSAFLMSTAMFLFCTETGEMKKAAVIRTFVLCGIAFMLRSEIALFLTPFFAFSVICRELMKKDKSFRKGLRNLLSCLGMLFLVFAFLYALDWVSCSGKEWREFRALFNARTELYDYETIPSWESASEMYSALGLDRTDVTVIKNYNYGIDERIDSRTLSGVAAYARSLRKSFPERLRTAVYVYVRQVLFDPRFRSLNIIMLVLYAAVIYGFFIERKYRFILMCPALFITRSLLWLYVIYKERYPERITFSLFMCEAFVLLFLILSLRGRQKRERRFTALVYGVTGILTLLILTPVADAGIRDRMAERVTKNRGDLAIKAYCISHPDIFFFEDVYSTVDFSEELPGGTRGQNPGNCAIMGGWACKSPLWDKKLKLYGIDDPQEALLSGKAQFICRLGRDTEWIAEFYAARGKQVNVRRIAGIMGVYGVYRINEISGTNEIIENK